MKPGTLHMLCSVGILLIGLYARRNDSYETTRHSYHDGHSRSWRCRRVRNVAGKEDVYRTPVSRWTVPARITELSGAGVNRLHPDEPGFLITIREYEKDGECWKVSGQTPVPKRMVPIVGAREGQGLGNRV